VVATGDTTVQDLIRWLNDWLRALPPEQERITKLIDELRTRFGERTDPVTATVCREIEAAAWAYSRHLALAFDPSAPVRPTSAATAGPTPT
jgi:alkanesulfonate monooxygenase SsuD/methylene tetrahydromethanopterin reductase-like flavin-dependent oxidoreductase (luciferase family)